MKHCKWFILTFILVAIDQIIKWFFISNPNYLSRIFEVSINNKFILGYGASVDLFFWISIFVILILAYFVMEKPANQNISFAVMLSGAFSNLIDRIFRGGVVDYFRINLGYEILFNLADIYLITGLFLYLFLLGRQHEKENDSKIIRNK